VTTIIEADSAARYVAKRKLHILFDDDITITTDPATGLLSAVNGTSTDQTASIAGAIASSVGGALTFGAELGPVGSYGVGESVDFEAVTNKAFFSSFQVTLTTSPGVSHLAAYVVSPDLTDKLYAWFDVELIPELTPAESNDFEAKAAPKCSNGIVVRLPVPYKVKITARVFRSNGANNMFQVPEQIVFLPSEKQDYYLPLTRSPFVANSTKVTLVNGMVQTLQQTRPSLVLGIVGVPKTILNALVPIPLQVRQTQQQNADAVDKRMISQADIRKQSSK